MKQKKSFFLTLIILIVLILGAVFAYNKLSSERSASNLSSLRLSNSSEESETPTETDAETEPTSETQSDSQTEEDSQTESETKPVSDTESETEPVSDTESETELISDTESKSQTDSQAQSRTVSQTPPDAGTSSQSSSDSQTASAASASEESQTEKSREASPSESQYTLAPDFTVTDADGNEVSLFSLLGKPAVLNFWNSNCPPCKMEMPDFQEMYEELGEEVSFIMIDTVGAMGETKESGQDYVEEQGFTFPVYYDTSQDAIYTYGIAAFPTTFFISKEGYLIAGAQGMIDKETLQMGIDMILEN